MMRNLSTGEWTHAILTVNALNRHKYVYVYVHMYVCIRACIHYLLQTCGLAERACEAGAQNASNDRNRMEINRCAAVARLDTLYDTQARAAHSAISASQNGGVGVQKHSPHTHTNAYIHIHTTSYIYV